MDDFLPSLLRGNLPEASTVQDILHLPKTIQALRILMFLREQLSIPFSDTRFSAPDIASIHKRHPAIVAMCKALPYVELSDADGIKLLITPLYRFFQSGQVLTWIEVMATARQMHIVFGFVKGLCRWLDKARGVDHPYELIEKMDFIQSLTKDLERIVLEYNSCLKRCPGEVYFISSEFLPKKSPLRSLLQVQASLRNERPATNFSERDDWEPFKFIELPTTVTSDPSFVSSNMSRFNFNSKASLLAFRGASIVVVFSAYTGAVVATFQFPKREIAFVAFSPCSSMLALSFSNSESRLLDLSTGTLIQELSGTLTSQPSGHEVRRNKSVSLGKRGKRLHTGHKTLELSHGSEELNFAATYLKERTSAVGPNGIHGLLTKDGIFKVSDETGDTLFFRRIRVDIEPLKPSLQRSLTTLKRGMSERWKSGHTSTRYQSLSKTSIVSEPSIQLGVNSVEVQYKCYDIGTHGREDIVIDKLMQQSRPGGQKKYFQPSRS